MNGCSAAGRAVVWGAVALVAVVALLAGRVGDTQVQPIKAGNYSGSFSGNDFIAGGSCSAMPTGGPVAFTNGSMNLQCQDDGCSIATFDINTPLFTASCSGDAGSSFSCSVTGKDQNGASLGSTGTSFGSPLGAIDDTTVGVSMFNVSGFFAGTSCSYQFDVNATTLKSGGAVTGISAFFPQDQRNSVFRWTQLIRNNVNQSFTYTNGLINPGEEIEPRYNTTIGASNGLVPIAGGLRYQGLAAGDGFDVPWGAWASYQHSDSEDNFAATAFDSSRDAIMFGVDVSPWENYVFGVGFGYENSDVDTTFNAGTLDVDGITIVPYMGVLLNDALDVDFDLSMSLAIGYSNLDINQSRGAVTGSTNSDRVFFSGNLNAARSFGNLRLGGLLGLLVARDDIDGFTQSDGTVTPDRRVSLGQLQVGADAAYSIDAFEPFASAIYEYDYERDKVGGGRPNDRNDVRVGAGIRYFGVEGISGSFEYSTVLDRQNFDDDTYTLTIRADF